MSSTPYKTDNALSPESAVRVAIAETAYFACLRLPSMQSCSRVKLTLLQNHKRKARFSVTTKYECFHLKLQGISSTSMHALTFLGYITLSWIEFICLPHTLTVDLVLHFMVWLSEAAHWYVQDNERLEISKSQEMWRKGMQMQFLKKPTTNPYIS